METRAEAFESINHRTKDKEQLGFGFKSDTRRVKANGSMKISAHQRADDGYISQSENSELHQNDFDDEVISPTNVALSGKVLILNGNYEPLAICNVQKAIILLYLRKAELVSALDGKAIRSTSAAIPYPSVVRLSNYVRVPFKKVILSRKNILRRDGHRCQYCGSASISLTVDHIMPRSRGGEDSWENLCSACLRCNNRKGSHTPDEAQMPLLKRPIRPNHVTFLRQYAGKVGKDWEPYLFM